MQFSAPSPMFSFLLYDTDWDRLCTIFLLCRLCSLLSSARGSDSKESTCNAGDAGLIPGLGRSPGEGHGNALQYSCLENPMHRGARQSTVHGLAKSQTWLSDRARIIQSVAFPRLAEPVSLETPAPASWPPLLRIWVPDPQVPSSELLSFDILTASFFALAGVMVVASIEGCLCDTLELPFSFFS